MVPISGLEGLYAGWIRVPSEPLVSGVDLRWGPKLFFLTGKFGLSMEMGLVDTGKVKVDE